MQVNPALSIVIPCYNEEKTIPKFINKIEPILNTFKKKGIQNIELLFVDDGSEDQTTSVISEYTNQYDYVHLIKINSNKGKDNALYEGIAAAKGDMIGVMDVDLQDPPELLLEMWEILHCEQVDQVYAIRTTRKDGKFRTICSHIFNCLSGLPYGIRDYRIMTKKASQQYLNNNIGRKFFRGGMYQLKLKSKSVKYADFLGKDRRSHWSNIKLIKYAISSFFLLRKQILLEFLIMCSAIAGLYLLWILV